MKLERVLIKFYRLLPLSSSKKTALKEFMFDNLAWAFGGLKAFRSHTYGAQEEKSPKSYSKNGNDGFGHIWKESFIQARKADPAQLDHHVAYRATAVDTSQLPVKSIAFYLPQFHPIPENDKWWGKGFTEWTNVTKAMPQFVGHYQPHLPAELGFYDLRLKDVMKQQIALAQHYGLHGFCFYHYWFSGKRLLEKPVEQFLADSSLNMPFCLCWANENWSRRWDGRDSELLMEQEYAQGEALQFIEELKASFDDPRYIRIDNKPVLLVYRVNKIPDPHAMVKVWRNWAEEQGYDGLYLVAVQSFDITDPRPFGFDAAVEFPPHQGAVDEISHTLTVVNPNYAGRVYSYPQIAEKYAMKKENSYTCFKGVMPGWDNEARKPGGGNCFAGNTPELFQKWVRQAAQQTMQKTESQRFLFINAWNEWAEGAHLEPDRKHGYAYLQALADGLAQVSKS